MSVVRFRDPALFKIKGLGDFGLAPFSLSATIFEFLILGLPELNDFTPSGVIQFDSILLLEIGLLLPGSFFQILIIHKGYRKDDAIGEAEKPFCDTCEAKD